MHLLPSRSALDFPKINLWRGTEWDQTLDCNVSNLAWQFSRKLLPERGQILPVFDALQLQTLCKMTKPKETMKRPVYHGIGIVSSSSIPRATTEIYIANKGDYSKPGTIEKTLRTLETAVRMSRQIPPGGRPVDIIVREGLYFLNDTLTLFL